MTQRKSVPLLCCNARRSPWRCYVRAPFLAAMRLVLFICCIGKLNLIPIPRALSTYLVKFVCLAALSERKFILRLFVSKLWYCRYISILYCWHWFNVVLQLFSVLLFPLFTYVKFLLHRSWKCAVLFVSGILPVWPNSDNHPSKLAQAQKPITCSSTRTGFERLEGKLLRETSYIFTRNLCAYTLVH